MAFGFWRKKEKEKELEEELRAHLDMAAQERAERGEDTKDARAAARREFGNVELVKEVAREIRGWSSVERTIQDVRFGLRTLAKSPGFTAAAILTLALGIGANTAIFSVFKAVLLNALPYRQPERLVRIAANDSHTPDATNVSFGEVQDFKERNHSFKSIALYRGWGGTLRGEGRPQNLRGMKVSADFFDTLGVSPALGRDFDRSEDQPERWRVVLLSYGFWKEHFGGRPEAVGRTISIDEQPFQIVGVLPENFQPTIFNSYSKLPEVWVPLGYAASEPNACRSCQHLRSVARLADGVTLEQARTQLNSIAPLLVQQFPKDYPSDLTIYVTPLDEALVGKVRATLWMLLGATGLVLLIACSNATNLLLSRGAARRREMALRAALGAGPLRLARQLLTEAALITLLGGAVGVLLAQTGLQVFLLLAPASIPRLNEVRLDGSVLLAALTVSLLTGVIVGLAPALSAARSDQRETLQQGTRGAMGAMHSRFRNALIVSEVALAFLLAVGTGLLLRSLHRVIEVDPGFQAHELYVSGFSLGGAKYAKDEAVLQFERETMNRLRAVPGINEVAIVSTLPLGGSFDTCGFQIQDRPLVNDSDAPSVDRYFVSPAYFATMGIRLLRGRVFTEADTVTHDAPVAIISETTAHQMWPNEDPLGKHIQLGGRNDKKPWATVVGIVGDVLQYGLDTNHTPSAYVLYSAEPGNAGILLARSRLSTGELQRTIEREIGAINKDVPVDDVVSMETFVAASSGQRRFFATLIACFGVLALFLSALGIYGVMAYQVTQRTNEIGIRMALGAPSSAILWQVVSNGMLWAFIGIGAGAIVSLALHRVLAAQLYGVGPTDATAFAAASGLLLASALFACFVPARRAMQVDPMVALRHE
jgi:putative ABC transport system permease protein